MGSAAYDVAIVGAGPAGSTLAIELAQRSCSVLLLEKAVMPRDKLCGEFLSTEVGGICSRLGVLDRMMSAGAQTVSKVRCSTPRGAALEFQLPGAALGLSRRVFDMLLFSRASELGAEAIDGSSVSDIDGSLADGFQLHTNSGRTYGARVVVGAYGRRTALDRKLNRPSLSARSPYVAFKAHYEGEIPPGQVEVYTFDGGYCGLLLEEDDRVNVCWITHQDRLKEAGGSPDALVGRMAASSAPLGERLRGLERTEPFLAVSQIHFRRKQLFANDVCFIGDAAGMIAPLCGDGMGMAIESALLAAPHIEEFLNKAISPAELHRRYSRAWTREFAVRMATGRLLQSLFVRPILLRPGLRLAGYFPAIAHRLVSVTRG